jgi:VWFA-related protein
VFDYRISAQVTKFSIRLGAVAAAAALSGPAVAARQTAQFRSTTELVSVDTIVTTPDGQQVADLTAKDFVLKVDGKPRPIQSVQFVRFNESRASGTSATPSIPSLPTTTLLPFATNTDPKGRTFIFAIDHNNIHPGNERPAIDAAIRLLDRLTPNDRVAVVTLPRGGVAADLSTDRAATRKALEGIIGHAPRPSSQFGFSIEEALAVFGVGTANSVDSNTNNLTKGLIAEMISRECGTTDPCKQALLTEAREYGRSLIFNTRDTILALSAFMTNLSSLEGTKSIVFISEGLIETADNRNDFNDLGRVADTSRVRMFVIQLNTPIYDINTRKAPANATGDIALELAGLQNVAGVTGGEIFRPSGRVDSAMDQIDRATSAYYLVGFEPNDKERDGKYHKIELSLVRKDLRIKSRSGFEIGAADKSSKKNAPDTSLTSVLHDNIRDYRDLPLRATAFAFRDEASNIKIVVLAETLGTGTMTSASFAVISESGGQGAEWTADAADLARSPVLTAGAVQPGRYRVRVAAGDALGRTGAVDVMVDARLTDAPPLQASSLMPGRLINGAFQPRLDFAGAPDVTGLIELYNVPLLAGTASVKFELAASPEGPALASADATVAAGAGGSSDRRIARGTVAIPPTAPAGNLTLRAQILLDGKVVGTVFRTISR